MGDDAFTPITLMTADRPLLAPAPSLANRMNNLSVFGEQLVNVSGPLE